jgi:hypothetical protein
VSSLGPVPLSLRLAIGHVYTTLTTESRRDYQESDDSGWLTRLENAIQHRDSDPWISDGAQRSPRGPPGPAKGEQRGSVHVQLPPICPDGDGGQAVRRPSQ